MISIREYDDICSLTDTSLPLNFTGVVNNIVVYKNENYILRVFDPSSVNDIKEIESKQITIFINADIKKKFIENFKKFYKLGTEQRTYEIFESNKLIFVNVMGKVRITSKINFLATSSFDILSFENYAKFGQSPDLDLKNNTNKAINQLCRWNSNPDHTFNFDYLQNTPSEIEYLLSYNKSLFQNTDKKYIEALRKDSDTDNTFSDNSSLDVFVTEENIESGSVSQIPDNPSNTEEPVVESQKEIIFSQVDRSASQENEVLQLKAQPPRIELSPPSSSQENCSPSPSPNKHISNAYEKDITDSQGEEFFSLPVTKKDKTNFNNIAANTAPSVDLKRKLSNVNLPFDESNNFEKNESGLAEHQYKKNKTNPTSDEFNKSSEAIPYEKQLFVDEDSIHFVEENEESSHDNQNLETQKEKISLSIENKEIQKDNNLLCGKNMISQFFNEVNSDEQQVPIVSDIERQNSLSETIPSPSSKIAESVSEPSSTDNADLQINNQQPADKPKILSVVGVNNVESPAVNTSSVSNTPKSGKNSNLKSQGVKIIATSDNNSKQGSFNDAVKEPTIVHAGVQTNINFLTMEMLWRRTQPVLVEPFASPRSYDFFSGPSSVSRNTPTTKSKIKQNLTPALKNNQKAVKIQGASVTINHGTRKILKNLEPILDVNQQDIDNLLEEGRAIESSPAKQKVPVSDSSDNDAVLLDYDDEYSQKQGNNISENFNDNKEVFSQESSNESNEEEYDLNAKNITNTILSNDNFQPLNGNESKINRLIKEAGNIRAISCNVIGIIPLVSTIPIAQHSSFVLKVVEAADYKRCISNNENLDNFTIDLAVNNTEALSKRLNLSSNEQLFKKVFTILAIGTDDNVTLNIRKEKDNTFQWFYKNKFNDALNSLLTVEKKKVDIQLRKSVTIGELNHDNFGKHDLYVNLVSLRIKKQGFGSRLLVTDFLDLEWCDPIMAPPVTTLNGHELTCVREVFIKDQHVFEKIVHDLNSILGLKIDKNLSNDTVDSRFFVDYPLLNYGIMVKLSGWTKEFRGSIDLNLNRLVYLHANKTLGGPPEEIEKVLSLYERFNNLTDQEFLQEHFDDLKKFLPYEKTDEGHIVFDNNKYKNVEVENYEYAIAQLSASEYDEIAGDEEVIEVESLKDFENKIENEYIIYKFSNFEIVDIKYYNECCLELLIKQNKDVISVFLLQEKNVKLMFSEGTKNTQSKTPIFDTLKRMTYPLKIDSSIFLTLKIIEFKKNGIGLKSWEMVGFDELWT